MTPQNDSANQDMAPTISTEQAGTISTNSNILNNGISDKLELLNKLKTNPLAILKVKDDFTKTVDEYLQNLIKNINDEKSDEGFEASTYKHLFSIASTEYFEKLSEIIYMSQFFYDTLYLYFFMQLKIEANDYEWYGKLVKLYKKVYLLNITQNGNEIEDENTYSDFTEEFITQSIGSPEFIKFISANNFHKKVHFIIHSILKKISLNDGNGFYIKTKEDIIYEISNIFKTDKTSYVKILKSNINLFIYVHKYLNEALILINELAFEKKISPINGGKFLISLESKIDSFLELNKAGSRKYYFELYLLIKENNSDNIIDADFRNKIFDYIAQEIIKRFYKNDLAIISTTIKESVFDKKYIPYKDWSKNSTYFNLGMIDKQDSENIIKLKDSIISIMKHPLSHLIYPVLLYKLRKSLKVSFKEFLYIEHLTNNVFAENYEEYKIMFDFNKDLKNLLFNTKIGYFYHLGKWFSWILLNTFAIYLLLYVFNFPVYFVSLLILYLYLYFKSEFFVETNLLGIKYYLGIIITVAFVINGGLDTNRWQNGIIQTYENISKVNGDEVFYKGINHSEKLVVEGVKNTSQFVADILKK